MLSYQHAYHAGSRIDVHKHAVLAVVLNQLTLKDKPLTYLETHAGRGLYDLTSPEAEKTQEAKEGILKLIQTAKIPAHHPYWRAIHLTQSTYGKNFYPGSPLVAKYLLRKNDEIHLMELHPQEYLALKANLRAPNVHVHQRDGYEGVFALIPPRIRRGLVLIDPSYEVKTEYLQAAEFVLKFHKKWPQAVVLLWYPLLDAAHHLQLVEKLKTAALPKFWQQEIIFEKGESGHSIRGSGLICVNLPFGLEEKLDWLG